MTGSYEREGFFLLVGCHEVKKSVCGGFSRVGAFAYPVDGDTDCGPAHHRQIERVGAIAHTATVFSGADIQAQVQTGLDSPVAAIRLEHLES